jgi:hypothetical protein
LDLDENNERTVQLAGGREKDLSAVKVELGLQPLLHGRVLRLAVCARLKTESGDLGSRRSHSR